MFSLLNLWVALNKKKKFSLALKDMRVVHYKRNALKDNCSLRKIVKHKNHTHTKRRSCWTFLIYFSCKNNLLNNAARIAQMQITLFLTFLSHLSSHFTIILFSILPLYSSTYPLTDSLWRWGDQEGSYCCPWLCCSSNQGAIHKFAPLKYSFPFLCHWLPSLCCFHMCASLVFQKTW